MIDFCCREVAAAAVERENSSSLSSSSSVASALELESDCSATSDRAFLAGDVRAPCFDSEGRDRFCACNGLAFESATTREWVDS